MTKERVVFGKFLGAEDGAEAVAIVDIIVVHVGTRIVAGYPRISVVVLA